MAVAPGGVGTPPALPGGPPPATPATGTPAAGDGGVGGSTGAAAARGRGAGLTFRFQLHSFSATGIPPADSDPYVVWQLPGDHRGKTSVKKNNVAPTWSEAFEFDYRVPSAAWLRSPGTELVVEVWDKNQLIADKLLGRARIKLAEFVCGPERHTLRLSRADGVATSVVLNFTFNATEIAATTACLTNSTLTLQASVLESTWRHNDFRLRVNRGRRLGGGGEAGDEGEGTRPADCQRAPQDLWPRTTRVSLHVGFDIPFATSSAYPLVATGRVRPTSLGSALPTPVASPGSPSMPTWDGLWLSQGSGSPAGDEGGDAALIRFAVDSPATTPSLSTWLQELLTADLVVRVYDEASCATLAEGRVPLHTVYDFFGQVVSINLPLYRTLPEIVPWNLPTTYTDGTTPLSPAEQAAVLHHQQWGGRHGIIIRTDSTGVPLSPSFRDPFPASPGSPTSAHASPRDAMTMPPSVTQVVCGELQAQFSLRDVPEFAHMPVGVHTTTTIQQGAYLVADIPNKPPCAVGLRVAAPSSVISRSRPLSSEALAMRYATPSSRGGVITVEEGEGGCPSLPAPPTLITTKSMGQATTRADGAGVAPPTASGVASTSAMRVPSTAATSNGGSVVVDVAGPGIAGRSATPVPRSLAETPPPDRVGTEVDGGKGSLQPDGRAGALAVGMEAVDMIASPSTSATATTAVTTGPSAPVTSRFHFGRSLFGGGGGGGWSRTPAAGSGGAGGGLSRPGTTSVVATSGSDATPMSLASTHSSIGNGFVDSATDSSGRLWQTPTPTTITIPTPIAAPAPAPPTPVVARPDVATTVSEIRLQAGAGDDGGGGRTWRIRLVTGHYTTFPFGLKFYFLEDGIRHSATGKLLCTPTLPRALQAAAVAAAVVVGDGGGSLAQAATVDQVAPTACAEAPPPPTGMSEEGAGEGSVVESSSAGTDCIQAGVATSSPSTVPTAATPPPPATAEVAPPVPEAAATGLDVSAGATAIPLPPLFGAVGGVWKEYCNVILSSERPSLRNGDVVVNVDGQDVAGLGVSEVAGVLRSRGEALTAGLVSKVDIQVARLVPEDA